MLHSVFKLVHRPSINSLQGYQSQGCRGEPQPTWNPEKLSALVYKPLCLFTCRSTKHGDRLAILVGDRPGRAGREEEPYDGLIWARNRHRLNGLRWPLGWGERGDWSHNPRTQFLGLSQPSAARCWPVHPMVCTTRISVLDPPYDGWRSSEICSLGSFLHLPISSSVIITEERNRTYSSFWASTTPAGINRNQSIKTL